MASLTVENLSKRYGKTVAVDNLSFHVKDGEFFTILGPSGCGKTTTFYLMAGLVDLDSGEVRINNRVVCSTSKAVYVPPKDRRISMLFQEFSIYPNMTIFEGISLPLKAEKLDKKEIERIVKKVAEIAGVEDLLERQPHELSGGQKRRAGLAKAIAKEPLIYLLDEPLTGCDAKMRVILRGELRKLQQKLKATFVVVTHDQVEAMAISDRIMLMRDGKKDQIGTPKELYHQPKNTFVAGFIGTPPTNLIDCTLTKVNRKLILDAKEFRIPVPSEIAPRLEQYVGKDIIIGIRPRYITIKPSKGELSRYSFKAKVTLIESKYPTFITHLKRGKLSLTVETDRIKGKVGDEVTLEMNHRMIHLFSKDNGNVIVNAIDSNKLD
jgi:multiple sugar transport system ATP-binding protein